MNPSNNESMISHFLRRTVAPLRVLLSNSAFGLKNCPMCYGRRSCAFSASLKCLRFHNSQFSSMPPETAISDPLVLRNVGRLTLSCIETDSVSKCLHVFELYSIFRILQDLKEIRFVHFCTFGIQSGNHTSAPLQIQKIITNFRIFEIIFS